jgi:hypothetical protein
MTATATITADETRAAALARFGSEPGAADDIAAGAADDIAAGAAVILVDGVTGGPGMGRAIQFLIGPAIRFADGSHIRATDPTEVIGAYLAGRRGDGDTFEAAAGRAARRLLAGATLPIDIVRAR